MGGEKGVDNQGGGQPRGTTRGRNYFHDYLGDEGVW
jgi:hypothetical protein